MKPTEAFPGREMPPIAGDSLEGISQPQSPSPQEEADVLRLGDSGRASEGGLRPVLDMIEEQARLHPDRIAVRISDLEYSYAHVNDAATRLAAYLRSVHELQPGALVGIYCQRSVRLIISILGVLKAGAAYVPIDPSYPKARVDFILKDSGVGDLIIDSDQMYGLEDYEGRLFAADLQLDALDAVAGPWTAEIGPDSLAYVIYTSGSTGLPKGVMVSHANLSASTQARLEFYPEPPATFFLLSSVAFDSSVAGIFWTLCTGGCLLLPEQDFQFDPDDFTATVQRHRVSHLLMVPSAYGSILGYPEACARLQCLRAVILAGEVLPLELARMHGEKLPLTTLYNEYGPTEGSVWSTAYTCGDLSRLKVVPIGRPVGRVCCYVLDTFRRPVPLGVAGELWIGGPQVAIGYLDRPELTADRFLTNPFRPGDGERMYRTGDTVRWLPDGNLEFVGRMDDQVKIRGYRIELGEVEAAVMASGMVVLGVVVAQQDAAGLHRLVAYVVPKAGLSLEALKDFLRSRLPEYMVPAQMVTMDQLPLTPNGKVDRKALAELSVDASAVRAPHVAASTPEELVLTRAMQSVLGVAQLGLRDDFFSMGGDSIKAIQIISEIGKSGWRLEIGDLFNHPVVGELAILMRPLTTLAPQEMVTGRLELSPIQRWMFEHYGDTAGHYNQAVLLRMKGAMEIPCLAGALSALQSHHDGLRTTFIGIGKQVEAMIGDVRFPVSLSEFPEDVDLESTAAALQSQVDMANGPLLRAAVFRRADGDRLLLILHHLVCDGISWRILLQDLALAYQQAREGSPIQLPAKTHAFKDWVAALQEFADSGLRDSEYRYWVRQDEKAVAELPVDMQGGNGSEADRRVLTKVFSAPFTSELLREAHHAYGTEINDLLLTALGLALREWTGTATVRIQMEGHGREDIGAELDTSRTVGWFTALYPLTLDLGTAPELGSCIKSIKEQLRQVPRHGLGHGVMKYLLADGDPFTAPLPGIEFNYLGQFDTDLDDGMFTAAPEEPGPMIAPDAPLLHGLGWNGMVLGGELRVNLSYSSRAYQAMTAQRLLDGFARQIEAIVAHCLGRTHAELTPSDLSLEGMSQEELEGLESSIQEL